MPDLHEPVIVACHLCPPEGRDGLLVTTVGRAYEAGVEHALAVHRPCPPADGEGPLAPSAVSVR